MEIYRPKKREIGEIPLAPIIDMFVCVIFFLILSTTFSQVTKQTLPPSGVSVITDPVAPPPLAPKLLIKKRGLRLHLILRWAGVSPGEQIRELNIVRESDYSTSLYNEVLILVREFKLKYPNEGSLQVGLSSDLLYQTLITTMDSVRTQIKDIVLISYNEVDAET